MLEDQLNQDLKKALLRGDKLTANTLRGLKNAILYAKVAAGSRAEAMSDDQLLSIFQKEAKKRQESADLYRQGGEEQRALNELEEKAIIERYLPAQLTTEEIGKLADNVIAEMGGKGNAQLGAVIGKVKQQAGPTADGAAIAQIVKQKLIA